jgi:hypothetical protein
VVIAGVFEESGSRRLGWQFQGLEVWLSGRVLALGLIASTIKKRREREREKTISVRFLARFYLLIFF